MTDGDGISAPALQAGTASAEDGGPVLPVEELERLTSDIVAALKTGFGDCVMNWLGARAWQRGIDVYSAEGLRWALARIRERPAYGQLRAHTRQIEELKAQF